MLEHNNIIDNDVLQALAIEVCAVEGEGRTDGHDYGMAVLDIGLLDGSGFKVLGKIRKKKESDMLMEAIVCP